MNVPIAQRTVGIEAQGSPNVSIKPITEGAFGANVARSNMDIAEAKGSVGKVIANVGQQLFDHMAAKRNQDQEQEVNDRVSQLNKDVDENLLYGKDGALTLSGVNTKGVTPVFDEQANALRTKYAKGLSASQTQFYDRLANTHMEVRRNAVIRHEVGETQKAEEQGIASRIENDANTYAIDGGDSYQSQALHNKAISEAQDLHKRRGDDESTTALGIQKVNDVFAKKALESHPEQAKTILATFNLSPEGKAYVQGKQVEVVQKDISVAALTYKPNSDGTPNLSSTLEYAESKIKGFTPDQQIQVKNFVKSQVSVKTAEIEQNREQNQKKFTNTALQMFNSGKGHDEIVDALVKKSNFDFTGYSATDKTNQTDYISRLFTDKNRAIGEATAYLNPEQKAALAEAKIMIAGIVGKTDIKLAGMEQKQPADDVYFNLLNQKVAGSNMTREQIMSYTNELSKDIKTPGRFWGSVWPNTEKAYKVTAEQSQASAIAMPRNKAVSALNESGVANPTEQQISWALNKYPELSK